MSQADSGPDSDRNEPFFPRTSDSFSGNGDRDHAVVF